MLPRLTLSPVKFFLMGVIAAAFCGCGDSSLKAGRKTGEVTGTITLNDQPLNGGVVCLIDEVDGDTALGTVGADGKFTVKYRLGAQVPTGKYKITVGPAPSTQAPSPNDLMKNPAKYKTVNPIPVKYRSQQSTDLNADVIAGANTLTLKMTGKP
jgi:hypothetical protein